jgi:hypothetical protein
LHVTREVEVGKRFEVDEGFVCGDEEVAGGFAGGMGGEFGEEKGV